MRHIDTGGTKVGLYGFQLSTHGVPELCVQMGQRLIHQIHPGRTDKGTAHGHALLLSIGQLAGETLQEILHLHHLRHLMHFLLDELLVLFVELAPQWRRHIVVDRHLRIQSVVLEDHGRIP